jgi:hypothetical protein
MRPKIIVRRAQYNRNVNFEQCLFVLVGLFNEAIIHFSYFLLGFVVCRFEDRIFHQFGARTSTAALSLRAGFLTSAAQRGASVFKMMDMSRHKSMETLSGYVRDARQFRDHAGAELL